MSRFPLVANVALLSSLILAAVLYATDARAQSVNDAWLANPCELLSADGIAKILPVPAAAVTRKPRQGKYQSECLLVDSVGQRSLRLVLHPAKDAARVKRQLDRLASATPPAERIEIKGHAGVFSANRNEINVGVDTWMVSLVASMPMSAEDAVKLASNVVGRIQRKAARE